MKHIYNVVYYRNDNLFDILEYENEYFSSEKEAKKFLLEIVDDEEKNINDTDFKFWKIKIIKATINQIEVKKEISIYDLNANLLYDSTININNNSDKVIKKENIGSIVYIEAFPWNTSSPCVLPTYGVIGDIYDNKYIVYTINKWKVVHFHVLPGDIKLVGNEDIVDDIIKLAKIINQKEVKSQYKRILDGDIYWFKVT